MLARSQITLTFWFMAVTTSAGAGNGHKPALPALGPIEGAVTALAFRPNSRLLAVGSYRRISLVDAMSGRVIRSWNGAEGRVTSLAFERSGGFLAAGSGTPGLDGEITAWEPATGRRLRSFAAHTDLIYGLAISPDERRLAAVSYDHQVSVWDMAALRSPQSPLPPRYLRDHTDSVFGVAFRPGGSQIATAAADRTIKIWDTDTGKRLYTLGESSADELCVAYRPDGKQLAAGGVDRTLRVWNVDDRSGVLARSGFAHDGAILHVLYSHSGASIFTCGEDKTVKQWNADTLAEGQAFPKQPDSPVSLAISSDDALIAVGCYDGTLTVYDARSHRLIRSWSGVAVPAKQHGYIVSHIKHPSVLTHADQVHKLSSSRVPQSSPRSKSTVPRPVEKVVASWTSGLPTRGLGSTRCAPEATLTDVLVTRQPGNETASTAQAVPVPCVVSGAVWNGNAKAPAPIHYYRFAGQKGRPLTVDVMARRDGSPLDAEIEVLDRLGKPIERAVLRPVAQTEITLFDKDSVSSGMRLILRPEFGMKDYVLVGRELLQINTLPKGPDDDYQFRSFRGQRTGLLGTTPEYHTLGTPVYKVEIHPPGSVFSPNGMPLTHVTYKNDDGGPLYGRDSYIDFTPPADADYIVRIADIRGQQGEKFAYKLRIHPPRPDFDIKLTPAAITVPKGGATLASVEAERREGFDGEILVRLQSLPPGFDASDTLVEPGETTAQMWVSKVAEVGGPTTIAPLSYHIVTSAIVDNKVVDRSVDVGNKDRRMVVGAGSNVTIETDRTETTITPGGATTVEARITRVNGFKGRVPLEVRNLPYGVRVDDIGLNGVLINESETSRKFVIRCEPWVRPQTRTFYVTAAVEGGVSNTAPPLTLRVTAPTAAR